MIDKFNENCRDAPCNHILMLLLATILVSALFALPSPLTVSFEIISYLFVTFLYYETTALSHFLWMNEQLEITTRNVEGCCYC